MDNIVVILSPDGLHCLVELTAIVILNGHIDVGDDDEGKVRLRYDHSECGHSCCFVSKRFDVGAAFLEEFECKADDFKELIQYVGGCWTVGAADGGGKELVKGAVINSLVIGAAA